MPVLQGVHRVITRRLLGQAGPRPTRPTAEPSRWIQRFESAASLNIHLHCLVLDGVYTHSADGTPEFVEVQRRSGARRTVFEFPILRSDLHDPPWLA